MIWLTYLFFCRNSDHSPGAWLQRLVSLSSNLCLELNLLMILRLIGCIGIKFAANPRLSLAEDSRLWLAEDACSLTRWRYWSWTRWGHQALTCWGCLLFDSLKILVLDSLRTPGFDLLRMLDFDLLRILVFDSLSHHVLVGIIIMRSEMHEWQCTRSTNDDKQRWSTHVQI